MQRWRFSHAQTLHGTTTPSELKTHLRCTSKPSKWNPHPKGLTPPASLSVCWAVDKHENREFLVVGSVAHRDTHADCASVDTVDPMEHGCCMARGAPSHTERGASGEQSTPSRPGSSDGGICGGSSGGFISKKKKNPPVPAKQQNTPETDVARLASHMVQAHAMGKVRIACGGACCTPSFKMWTRFPVALWTLFV